MTIDTQIQLNVDDAEDIVLGAMLNDDNVMKTAGEQLKIPFELIENKDDLAGDASVRAEGTAD